MESTLLEQYKMFVEMADRVSQRRMKANQFYITLLSGLLALISLVIDKNNSLDNQYNAVVILASGLLGIVFCILWHINIRSYRQLNTKKFEVIQNMEKGLDFAPYSQEWDLLGQGKDSKKYFQLTRIEKLIPMVIIIPYLIITTFSLVILLNGISY